MSILSVKPKDSMAESEALAAELKDLNQKRNELQALASGLDLAGDQPGDRRPWWHATIAVHQQELLVCTKQIEYYTALSQQCSARHAEAQAALHDVEDNLAKELGLGSRAELGISEMHAWPKWIACNRQVTLTSANSFGDSIRTANERGQQVEGQIAMLEAKIQGDDKKRARAAAEELANPVYHESAMEYLERTATAGVKKVTSLFR